MSLRAILSHLRRLFVISLVGSVRLCALKIVLEHMEPLLASHSQGLVITSSASACIFLSPHVVGFHVLHLRSSVFIPLLAQKYLNAKVNTIASIW